jgi:hypothetical protein
MNSTQKTIPAAIPAAIPASSIAQATQETQAAPALRYVLMNRPQRGTDLFAHTAAAFEALGLFAGEYVERETMLRVWGATALKYHAEKFRAEDGAYALNDEGFSKFGEWRTIDPEKAAAFLDLLTTGRTDAQCIHASYRATKPV